MDRFLKLYLVVTGVLGLLSILFPDLVVMGMFCCLVPGLLLGIMPTAFLWGACFSGFWFALRWQLGEGPAAVVALVGTVFLLYAIPTPANWAAARVSTEPDVEPTAPIALVGDVRLDLVDDTRDPTACDALCTALLFAPQVTSVTVNTSSPTPRCELQPEARTYRLRSKQDCEGTEAVEPLLQRRDAIFGATPPERRGVANAYLARLAADRCVVQEPAVLQRHDLVIEQGVAGPYAVSRAKVQKVGRWSLASSLAELRWMEIRDASGGVLARVQRASARAPFRPLVVDFETTGGIPPTAWFRWKQSRYDDGKPETTRFEVVPAVLALTDLPGALLPPAQPGSLAPSLRASLDEALGDPTKPAGDPAFKVLEPYGEALRVVGAAPEDAAVVDRAFADHRVREFWRARSLPEAFGGDLSPFRDAIVGRIATNGADEAEVNRDLSTWLVRFMPDGTFAVLTPAEEALLADPTLRTRAPGLIGRLSDQGAAAVPRLLELLDFHTGHAKDRDHEAAVEGVRIALCRLGTDGASALPDVERRLADGSIPAHVAKRDDWRLTLARLGMPLEEVFPPDDASDYLRERRRLGDRLANLKLPKGCGW